MVVLVMFNKMLGLDLTIRLLLSIWDEILKAKSFHLYPFLTLNVRNGPSVRVGTNVPCI